MDSDLLRLGAILVGLITAMVTIWRVLVWRRTQQVLARNQAFSAYLAAAQQYPRQAAPGLFEIERGSEEWVRYTYFVASMLHVFECVLQYTRNEPAWNEALRAHLRYHWRYLRTPEFKHTLSGYDRRLVALINDVVRETEGRATQQS